MLTLSRKSVGVQEEPIAFKGMFPCKKSHPMKEKFSTTHARTERAMLHNYEHELVPISLLSLVQYCT